MRYTGTWGVNGNNIKKNVGNTEAIFHIGLLLGTLAL
jgi:hypothetical protein